MHLDLPHLVYPGAPLDDPGILDRLPGELAAALRARNGCVAFQGGLHVRGATRAPVWHSLRDAWEGPDALHRLFPEVRTDDVPFAEDAFGDQFLVRDGRVLRVSGELGELSVVADSLESFFTRLLADPEEMLDYAPLLGFLSDGGRLQPGQLLAAYPPFALEAEGAERELRPADALERRRLLAELAGRLHGLPDGTEVRLERDA
ncbi:MAG TPA: hypothetical protein VFZ26_00130 [Gemmatimonadales bacterium]